jgi:hypothetical protein
MQIATPNHLDINFVRHYKLREPNEATMSYKAHFSSHAFNTQK